MIQPHLLLRAPRLLAALALFASLSPLVGRADTVRLTDDAGTTTGVFDPAGTATTFLVKGKPGKAKQSVGYVKFDLTDLPAGTTASNVGKATLRVFVASSTKAGGTFDVRTVTGPFSEDGINANNAPTLGNTVATGIAAGPDQALTFISVDVTSAVQAWLAGTTANNGLALVPNANIVAAFDTKENDTTAHPATLDISLTSAAATGATGPAGPQGPQGVQGIQGIKGDKGDIGATGLKGDTGTTGLKGDTGAAGTPGTPGTNGTNGTPGAPGTPGTNGINGTAATVSLGTVTTGAAGSAAAISNSGTTSAAVFNFSIPTGATGAPGAPGTAGTPGAAGASGVNSYGTGEAGTRTYATNTTTAFAEDNTQYTDFTVANDAVLNVSSGTIIHCTGVFTVNGTINVGTSATPGSNYGSANGTVSFNYNTAAGSGTTSSVTPNGVVSYSTLIPAPGSVTGMGNAAKYLIANVRSGGGGGGGSVVGTGGFGGGAFTVIARGGIVIKGSVLATGGVSSATGGGGGAGGIVVFATPGTVTLGAAAGAAATTISVAGGAGGAGASATGPGGGGAGGVVHFICSSYSIGSFPVVLTGGAGGAAGAAGDASSNTYHSSGAGGGSFYNAGGAGVTFIGGGSNGAAAPGGVGMLLGRRVWWTRPPCSKAHLNGISFPGCSPGAPPPGVARRFHGDRAPGLHPGPKADSLDLFRHRKQRVLSRSQLRPSSTLEGP